MKQRRSLLWLLAGFPEVVNEKLFIFYLFRAFYTCNNIKLRGSRSGRPTLITSPAGIDSVLWTWLKIVINFSQVFIHYKNSREKFEDKFVCPFIHSYLADHSSLFLIRIWGSRNEHLTLLLGKNELNKFVFRIFVSHFLVPRRKLIKFDNSIKKQNVESSEVENNLINSRICIELRLTS
jgi:hypothetical protein